MNINRDYLIINDVKKSNIKLDNGSMFFYITDKNTQNIFVNLVINISNNDLIQKYANIENAEDYTLTMNIVKPSNTYKVVEGKLHDKEKAIFEFNLNEDCCDEIGTYRCELLTKCNIDDHEEITTSNKLTYKVKSSVLNDLDDIVEAPEYPLVIQLFDKLSDINQYEEDRRTNELARQLAEEQRQAKHDELVTDMTNSIQEMDDKVTDIDNRVLAKEQAVDKLITDTKAEIDEYKVAKDQEIDEYKIAKDTEINNAIANQDNKIDITIANQDTKIDTAISNQNDRIAVVENNEAAQNNRLDTLENRATQHESRLTNVEAKNTEQDGRLDIVENKNQQQDNRLDVVEAKNVEQDNRLNEIEAIDVAQNTRLDAIEIKNQQQDDRLLDVEKVNKRQDMDLKCLFTESKNNMIDITEEGNSIYLQNSTVGYTLIDEIQGNTMVNCNKEPDKEIILNGNINTRGYSNVTLTEGVNGGLVDVALEGNTMVNVCDQKDPVAITKSYTVETGNHVALQGEYDGKCRPVVIGNTLVNIAPKSIPNPNITISYNSECLSFIYPLKANTDYTLIFTASDINLDTNTSIKLGIRGYNVNDKFYAYAGDTAPLTDGINKFVINNTTQMKNMFIGISGSLNTGSPSFTLSNVLILEGDYTNKPIPEYFKGLQSSFEDNLVTQEMVDNGEELAENLGKYKVDYVISREDGTVGQTKTFYLNSPLLEGDTIEQQGDNVVHVHRSEIRAYETDDELTLPTDMTNTLVAKATPQYEVISQNDTILCDSYVNGHLDVDSVVPIEKVDFLRFEKDLTYLYANTQYAVQFTSDKAVTVDITLGGTKLLAQSIVAGLNRITITTPETLSDNKLIIDGVGANISEVVVTNSNKEFSYFEGMKSAGECEDLEIVSSNSDGTLSNTQTLTHEPLRAVGDIKDKYVLIDGKWYIERNCAEVVLDGSEDEKYVMSNELDLTIRFAKYKDHSYRAITTGICDKLISSLSKSSFGNDYENVRIESDNQLYIRINKTRLTDVNVTGFKTWLQSNPLTIIAVMKTPQYEPIDYNPFTVYSDVTHINNNSTIPCNMTIKNTGYNCLLKPSTTYTVSSNLGLNIVTTPSTLTEDCLRFYDTDTSTVTTMKNVTILEGDYTTGKPIPSHFSGIESAFEQEYDEAVGKYKVKIRVQNEDASKENYIEFYIDEPLRGIGDIKDKVYVKNDKVVVERNCGQRGYQDGDFGTYLTDKVNTVYQLAEPVYEEVEYNDTKLFIESFKNSTLSYNSNVPVTSKLYYSYSVPIVDTVARTASITDEQDSMIIDLATQCAVMEMMLM